MPQAQLFREPDAPDQPRGNEVVGGDDGPNIGGEAPGPVLAAVPEPDEHI